MAQKSNTVGRDIGTGAVGGTLGGVASEILMNTVVAPVGQLIDDTINFHRNIDDLKDNVRRMKNRAQDISNRFEDQQRLVPKSIEDLLERMWGAITEGNQLINLPRGQQTVLEPFIYHRQVRELNTKFVQLMSRDIPDDVLALSVQQFVSSAPQRADILLRSMPKAGVVGRAIESAATELQTWINADNPPLPVIGIYGMPGVGKTTVLGEVHNFYRRSNVFDVVIWLTVSQDYTISDLQGHIAEAIDLDLSRTCNPDSRTMKLSQRLKNMVFLLVLDDIWSSQVLRELGVQSGVYESSKVVFSTRHKDIALTEANKYIMLEPLHKEEGCELFEKVAFNGKPAPEGLKEYATKIADECKGLPLAITVVAGAMRSKTEVSEWDSALTMMKYTDPFFSKTARFQEELYQVLRWSYNDLAKIETPGLQSCFLYCAMYPEDEEIWVDDLVRMWIAEGFVENKMASYSEDMKRGFMYVKVLIDRGLFQSVNFEKHVNVWKKRFIRVHDVIRDMAILIAEEENNYLCRAGLQLEKFPSSMAQGCKRISLYGSRLDSLPADLQCTQLVSLILSQNPLCSLPTFLTHSLSHLTVLDLSNTQIESVPPSLTHLKVLDLSNTQIESVPTYLTHLLFLTMRNTCIKELPKDIGNLSNLHFLDISECKYLKSLPMEICQLTSLKRLHLSMGLEKYAVNDANNVMALKGLKNLIELHLYMFFKFEEHEIMGTIMGSWVEMKHLYLHYKHMESLKSNLPEGMKNMKKLESLVLSGYTGEKLPDFICEFEQLERLELNSCDTVTKLPPLERLPKLKFLKLKKYSKVGNLQIGSFGLQNGFPKLEILYLSDMNVRILGPLEKGTLLSLQVLKVKKCPKLRLSAGMKELTKLRALYGHKTSWWEKLVWEDQEMKIWLHKLFKEI